MFTDNKTRIRPSRRIVFLSVLYEIQVTTKYTLSDQYLSPHGTDLAFRNFSAFEDFRTTHHTSP